MTTRPIYREEPYCREAEARVLGHGEGGAILVDASVFYPAGGGQPGDSGFLDWEGGRLPVATTVKLPDGLVGLVPAEALPLPPAGAAVRMILDWERRHRHMRVHTALHLLSVVIPLPVTGGQIGAERGRLDFDMPEPPADVAALEERLNDLIARDLAVTEDWITDEELLADPSIVKTMSVMPPVGQGRVRLVRIGAGEDQVDLQPCGGTHVARTGEIGRVAIGRIEKKGRQNRRVSILLAD